MHGTTEKNCEKMKTGGIISFGNPEYKISLVKLLDAG
jgi:hypothetical protein